MLPSKIEAAVYGFAVTPVLYLADKIGLFSHLLDGDPISSAALAECVQADADTVDRLLLVLAAAELVRRDDRGNYMVDAVAAPFVDQANPSYIGGFVQHLVDGAPELLIRIEDYLAKGKDTVDAELAGPYERFYDNDKATCAFMGAMWSLSYDISRELAALADLRGHRLLVDVGGANGPFSIAALQQFPELRAVLFDLPQIQPHLEQSREKYGLADRLAFVPGDFFCDELPIGDAIAMGYVMSNWPDEQCKELLCKAFRACEPGGKILIMDRLFDDNKTGPLSTAVMHLIMQVETHGVHRTSAEFSSLMTAVGFRDFEVVRSSRDKHLLIGHKPVS
jgi:hypothetical protein